MERKTKEILFGAAIMLSLVGIFIPYVLLNGQIRLGEATSDIPSSPVWPEQPPLSPPTQPQPQFQSQAQAQAQESKDNMWVVSVGAYDTLQEAEAWVKKLQAKNLPAYLKTEANFEPESALTQYWVLVGPKLQKQAAMNIMQQLKKDKIATELKIYHPNMVLE